MTFKQFNPSSDKLEVGTRFDLAGTKGEIIDIDETPNNWPHNVWIESDPDADTLKLDLTKFPGLLIEDKPAKPLTIDKRVKGEMFSILGSLGENNYSNQVDAYLHISGKIRDYLNSLEET